MILLVLQNQDGIAKESAAQLNWIGSKIVGADPEPPPARSRPPVDAAARARERVAPKALEVRDLTVRYGGVTAVDASSLTVAPGHGSPG